MMLRDEGMFQGYKQFGGYQFEDCGGSWLVRVLTRGAWVPVGRIDRLRRESNYKLLERGRALGREVL